MTENIKTRGVKDVLEELFYGRDAALEKYAKVRHTQYEMCLWYKYRKQGYKLSEVPKGVKIYFSQRYLGGKKIDKASEKELEEAFKRLGYAVENGCEGRCGRLVEELNQMLAAIGLETIKEPTRFLNWLTFDYEVRRDYENNPVLEKPYGFEIRIFHDERNRKEFWGELQLLLYTYGRMMPMQKILKSLLWKRQASVSIRG